MFDFIKRVISDSETGNPSTKRWVLVVSTVTLCAGFLIVTSALAMGYAISDAIVLGLAGIIAGMAGGSYTYTKSKELEAKIEITKKEGEL